MASPQKEHGHLEIAHEIVEVMAKTYLSNYESRILWCLWRKTWGWNKKEDAISNSQFCDMTGLQKSHVSRTLKILAARNIVTQTGNYYRFNKDYSTWTELSKDLKKGYLNRQQKLPKLVTGVTQTGNDLLPKRADTIETNKNYNNRNNIYRENPTENATKVLDVYNRLTNKRLKVAVGIAANAEFWMAHYTLEDIEHAFEVALVDPFWKKIITPEIMLRRKNPRGEAVDWIGTFSSKWKPKPAAAVFEQPERVVERSPEEAARIQKSIETIRERLGRSMKM